MSVQDVQDCVQDVLGYPAHENNNKNSVLGCVCRMCRGLRAHARVRTFFVICVLCAKQC